MTIPLLIPDNFEVLEELASGPAFTLQRVGYPGMGARFIRKRFRHQQAPELRSQKLAVGLAREIKWETALVPQQYEEEPGGASIFYQDMPGYCLRQYMTGHPKIAVKDFMPLAMALARMVSGFHLTGWVIKNICPENIMLSEDLGACKIIDAQRATNTYKNESRITLTSGDSELLYISPEQTGMLNRVTDYRTDYYSLGVIFFELLTGRHLFGQTDPLALMHAHVTAPPDQPVSLNRLVPEMLSRIVLKLLAKNAEDRYQSPAGLLFDLEQVSAAPWGKPFQLGSRDETSRITITNQLVGRKKELAILVKAFSAISLGTKQLIYIRGYSGVGKTRLVQELQKSRLSVNQKMISAKFDILQKQTPYSALIHAVKELIKGLLQEDELRLAFWKERLLGFLNENGKILTDVVPELAIIIGEQPHVNALPPDEAQNRFHQTVISFIKAFSTDDFSLCVFLDDLQWADIASIKLIELIVLDDTVKNLLFIGAYRDNEVDLTHPLSISLKKQEQWQVVKDIYLEPLELTDTAELVLKTLQNRVLDPDELVSTIFKKTQGNTFYILQLLTALFEEKSLQLTSSGWWQWDPKAIAFHDLNQNVAGLLSEKICGLSPELRTILKCAACLGDIFDLKTTAHLAGMKLNQVAKELSFSINNGFVLSLDDNFDDFLKTTASVPDDVLEDIGNSRFKFAHDRVRQAALELAGPDEHVRLNLLAGKLKMALLGKEDLMDELFYLANNFNIGAPLISSPEEIAQLVELNLKAGIKAKNSTAYEAAITYFESGKKYLNFEEHYATLYTYYLEAAVCKFLTGRYDEAEKDLDLLFEKAVTKLDKLNALFQKVYLYNTQDLKVKAVETGRLGFRLFGLRMPESKLAIMCLLLIDLLKANFLLSRRQLDSLIERTPIKDKEMERFLEFILCVAPTIYQYDQNLFAWNTMKMVLYSLKYGKNGIASFGYIGYGMIISELFGQYVKAKKLADVAVELNNELEYTPLKWKVLLSYYNFVHHWTEPVRPVLDVILEVANGAYANGDPTFAGYAIFIYHQKSYALGLHLTGLQESFEEYLKLTTRRQEIETFHFLSGYYHAILCLRGTEQNILLLGGEFNAPAKLKEHIEKCSFSVVADTFIAYMSTLFIFGYYREAYEQYLLSITYMPFIKARYDYVEFNLYGALICAQACRIKAAPASDLIKRIKKHVHNLKTWESYCAANFEPQFFLASAELERVTGKDTKAAGLFEKAIASAEKHLFINYKAIACELAGENAYRSGNQMMAKSYLDFARQSYLQWGATAKVMQIEKTYQSILGRSILTERDEPGNPPAQNIDLALLLQTTHAVKSEKDIDRLVEQLMKTIIQYAGADTGYLLIHNQADLVMKAQYNVEEGVRSMTAYPDGNLLPLTVIRYVGRLKEPLILHNPAQNSDYYALPYFKNKQPRSLLCYPVLKQGDLFGIIYLENYTSEDAFNEQRISMLHLISSQMAMLLDNAYLYDNLEAVVKERISAIETRMDISDELLRNVLPGEAIEELKATGKTTARKFEQVSVLMADIKGFTILTEKLTPEELIGKIDLYFRAFDEIMTEYGLEKIKTIGDAYMAAGGLGSDPLKGAVSAIHAAIKMQQFVSSQGAGIPTDQQLTLRIGIHTGTVIAGVVGSKKYQYDIWGDAVNVAARMEQNSEPGKVNVSKVTADIAADAFSFIYRGKIEAKNKGKMDMYFVEDRIKSSV